MRIELDYEICSSAGQCVYAAPNVFRIENGTTAYDPDPAEAERDAVEEAVVSCPVQAISILS